MSAIKTEKTFLWARCTLPLLQNIALELCTSGVCYWAWVDKKCPQLIQSQKLKFLKCFFDLKIYLNKRLFTADILIVQCKAINIFQ